MFKNSIVLVPFPFDDFSNSKVRPALCLTSKIGKYENIIMSFISSNLNSEILDSDLVIYKNSKYWEGTGLISDSIIRLHKIVTLPNRIILKKLGMINNELEAIILSKLLKLLEIY